MLNEKQIDDYYDSLTEYFLDQNKYSVKLADDWLRTSSLMDYKRRLVYIAKEPMTVRSLANENCKAIYSFFTKADANYEIWVEKKKCWLWLKDINVGQWVRNTNISNFEELYYYILMNQKGSLMDKIHDQVNYYRNCHTKTLDGQDYLYALKYIEAKEIISKGIVQDDFMNYPFTKTYAELKNISLNQAAKEILMQNEIERDFLAESEFLRMKYTNIIRKETDIKNLKKILVDFETENYMLSSL